MLLLLLLLLSQNLHCEVKHNKLPTNCCNSQLFDGDSDEENKTLVSSHQKHLKEMAAEYETKLKAEKSLQKETMKAKELLQVIGCPVNSDLLKAGTPALCCRALSCPLPVLYLSCPCPILCSPLPVLPFLSLAVSSSCPILSLSCLLPVPVLLPILNNRFSLIFVG